MNNILKDFNLVSVFDYDANELEAKIIAIFDKNFKSLDQTKANEQSYIVLDKTCIYALSGGQEADKGYIQVDNDKIDILDCLKTPNNQHLHLIKSNKILSLNQSVKVVCNQLLKDVISANHTAEHLLQGTLQKFLSPDLIQKGVNLTHNSLSVSYFWPEKLTDKQLKDIEDYINTAIAKAIPVEVSYKTLEEARNSGVRAKFDEVYSKVKGLLRVVKIDDIYNVLCAGRHAHNTKDLQQFHIIKLSSKGSNVWKIEAIATDYLTNQYIDKFNKDIQTKITSIKDQTSINNYNNPDFIKQLDSIKLSNDWDQTIANLQLIDKLSVEFNKLIDIYKQKQLEIMVNEIVTSTKVDETKQYNLIVLDNKPANILNKLGSLFIKKYVNNGFVIINKLNNKLTYLVIKHPNNSNILKSNELIKQINTLVNGKGGGNINQCQGSCLMPLDSLDKIVNLINSIK